MRMHFRVLARTMPQLLLELAEHAENQQPEQRTDQGDRDLPEPGGGARRCSHPDSRRGREAMYSPLGGELENGAAAQETYPCCEPLHDPRYGIRVHT